MLTLKRKRPKGTERDQMMTIIRRSHPFRIAFSTNRNIHVRGRVAYVLGMWYAIAYK